MPKKIERLKEATERIEPGRITILTGSNDSGKLLIAAHYILQPFLFFILLIFLCSLLY